jgi:hypothetical protein
MDGSANRPDLEFSGTQGMNAPLSFLNVFGHQLATHNSTIKDKAR